jgi:cyclopropane fatty-acyl-phospholipid synthase-like methyltransferase
MPSNLPLLYEAHARACDPKDFQDQVMRRGADGGRVDEAQVEMIVAAIIKGLALEPDDVLLDLGCGNGAITDRVFGLCKGGLGVDFTPHFIDVAKANFERAPDRLYRADDVTEFVQTAEDSAKFTKVLHYGALMHFGDDTVIAMLTALRERFANVRRIFIGQVSDLDRAKDAFPDVPRERLRSLETLGGTWRTESEVVALAKAAGWRAEISRMPAEFFSAHFKFDATLSRRTLAK